MLHAVQRLLFIRCHEHPRKSSHRAGHSDGLSCTTHSPEECTKQESEGESGMKGPLGLGLGVSGGLSGSQKKHGPDVKGNAGLDTASTKSERS